MSWFGWNQGTNDPNPTPNPQLAAKMRNGKPKCPDCKIPLEICEHTKARANGLAAPAAAYCLMCGSAEKCKCNPTAGGKLVRQVPAIPATQKDPFEQPQAPRAQEAAAKVTEQTCETCRSLHRTCICPKIWGARELEIRAKLARTELISHMNELLHDCAKVETFPQQLRDFCTMLAQQGAHLQVQEDLLVKRRNNGVLNEDILQQHADAINKWIAVCEKHLALMMARDFDSSNKVPLLQEKGPALHTGDPATTETNSNGD